MIRGKFSFLTVGMGALLMAMSSCYLQQNGLSAYEQDEAFWQPGETFGKPEVLSAGELNSSGEAKVEKEEDYYDPNLLKQEQGTNDYYANGGLTPMWDPIMGWRLSYPWGNGIGLNNPLSLGLSFSPWGSYPSYGYSPYAYNGFSSSYGFGNGYYGAPLYGNYWGSNNYYGYNGYPYYGNGYYGNGTYGNGYFGNGSFWGNNQQPDNNQTHVQRPNGTGAASQNEAPVVHRKPKNLPVNTGHVGGSHQGREIVKSQDKPKSERGNVWREIGKVVEEAAKASSSAPESPSFNRGNSSPSSRPSESPARSGNASRGSGSFNSGGGSPSHASPSRSGGGRRP